MQLLLQRGVGFVSPPAQFPIFSFLGGLGASSRTGEEPRSVAEPKMDNFDELERSGDAGSSAGDGLMKLFFLSSSLMLLTNKLERYGWSCS